MAIAVHESTVVHRQRDLFAAIKVARVSAAHPGLSAAIGKYLHIPAFPASRGRCAYPGYVAFR